MNRIKSFIGRRQFLLGTFMASTSTFTLKKIADTVGARSHTGVAMASDMNPDAEAASGGQDSQSLNSDFSSRYRNLLSPLRLGNVLLKTRMYSTNAVPHYLQGPENFPSEELRSYCANLAKNGAAIVTPRIITGRVRKNLRGDSAHMVNFDLEDYGVQNYLDQMAEAVHCYGSKISYPMTLSTPPGYQTTGKLPGEEMSTEVMNEIIEGTVKTAKFFQNHGFDMMCLRDNFTPTMKNRKDQYGGSVENSSRFSIELYTAIKDACGQDFLIESPITVIEPSIRREEGDSHIDSSYTLEDAIEFAKQWEGLIDILHIRVAGGMANHPTGFNSERGKPLTIRFSQAIKESGAGIFVAPNGGYQDLDLNEEYIASGKADLIGMGHAFICDWEYGKKACQGRGEDVVPCIMCNKCHGLSMGGEWYTVCSVNPKVGITTAVRLLDAPETPRTVAVIGGGPTGMKAAITAAERGHKVTLYEKNDYLGGQLRHTDFASFKWPYKDFKDYLIRQTYKAGIEVLLNTRATPEMIKREGYDVVMVAVGAEPINLEIPGADGNNVRAPIFVYGGEKALGKHVVILGGGEIGDEEAIIGVETGIYLAQNGHDVTMLTSRKEMARAYRVHYPDQVIDTYNHLKNFASITEAHVEGISGKEVAYTDSSGVKKSIQADNVVVSVGRRPRLEEALDFYGSADRFVCIGDCSDEGGNVQKCIRSAFFAAAQI